MATDKTVHELLEWDDSHRGTIYSYQTNLGEEIIIKILPTGDKTVKLEKLDGQEDKKLGLGGINSISARDIKTYLEHDRLNKLDVSADVEHVKEVTGV